MARLLDVLMGRGTPAAPAPDAPAPAPLPPPPPPYNPAPAGSESVEKTIARADGLTAEEMLALQEQFSTLDHNGDGRLTEKEFCRPLSYLLGDRLALLLFRAFDVNGDGHITFAEFQECVRLVVVGTPQEKLAFSFKLFDSDRKGYVVLADFADLMSVAQDEHQLTPTEVVALFMSGDTNHDGYISFEEFQTLMLTHPAMQGHYYRTTTKPAQERGRPLVLGTKGWKVVMPLLRAIQHFILLGPAPVPERVFEIAAGATCTEYEPDSFARLRQGFGYAPEDYLRNLGLNKLLQNLLFGALVTPQEMTSSGSSGSYFFLTPDSQLIIKTVKTTEARLLLDILPLYCRHHSERPESLLSRIYGLYSCTTTRRKTKTTLYFAVMMNIHPISLGEVTAVFDLKGSSTGRSVPPGKRKGPLTALKDLDLPGPFVVADPAELARLHNDIHHDVHFLRTLNIMDYSLLVCVCIRSAGVSAVASSVHLYRYLQSVGREAYYVGIIDILTPFNARRWGEFVYKRFVMPDSSCVPPSEYADRFLVFVRSAFVASPTPGAGRLAPGPPTDCPSSPGAPSTKPPGLPLAARDGAPYWYPEIPSPDYLRVPRSPRKRSLSAPQPGARSYPAPPPPPPPHWRPPPPMGWDHVWAPGDAGHWAPEPPPPWVQVQPPPPPPYDGWAPYAPPRPPWHADPGPVAAPWQLHAPAAPLRRFSDYPAPPRHLFVDPHPSRPPNIFHSPDLFRPS